MLKFALTALLLATSISAARAQDDAPTVAVSYRDLNLSDPAGIAVFDHRIAVAIRQVCPDGPGIALADLAEIANCRNHAHLSVAPQRARALAAAVAHTKLAFAH